MLDANLFRGLRLLFFPLIAWFGPAHALLSGQRAFDSLTSNGQVISYPVNALAGETILARLVETATVPGRTFTPRLELRDPGGNTVASNQGTVLAAITYQATQSGAFSLRVLDGGSGGTGQGSYVLHLVVASKAFLVLVGDEGGNIAGGGTRDGIITAGDLDTWSLNASEGQTILAQVGETGVQTLAPRLRLFTPSGQEVGNAHGSAAAGIRHTAQSSGTYLLVVEESTSDPAGTGPYRLHTLLASQPFVPADDGGPLTSGERRDARIDLADMDPWSLEAGIGQTLQVRVGKLSPGDSLVPLVRLYAPDGGDVSPGQDDAGSAVLHVATVAGTYLAVVHDGNSQPDGTGDYRIHAIVGGREFQVSDDGGTAWSDEAATGSLTAGDLDPWAFEALAGQSIRVMAEGAAPSFAPAATVFAPNGQLIGSLGAGPGQALDFTATSTGLHLVSVHANADEPDAAGDYAMTVSGSLGRLYYGRDEDGPFLRYPVPLLPRILEYSPSLAPTNWTEETNVPTTNGFHRLPLDSGRSQGYFRLAPAPGDR